jgi:xanthine/CO dehydrogenase XdhC/CoxF family maturation factor
MRCGRSVESMRAPPCRLLERRIVSALNLPVFREALTWRQGGGAIAKSCVVETWGPAPRSPDSRLMVDADGNFSGSVSGGCVEAEVISAALEVMQAGAPRLRAPITTAFVRCRHRSR